MQGCQQRNKRQTDSDPKASLEEARGSPCCWARSFFWAAKGSSDETPSLQKKWSMTLRGMTKP